MSLDVMRVLLGANSPVLGGKIGQRCSFVLPKKTGQTEVQLEFLSRSED